MLFLHNKTKKISFLSSFITAQMWNQNIMWLLNNAKCSHCFVMPPLQNPPLCSSNDWTKVSIFTQLWEELPPKGTFLDAVSLQHLWLVRAEDQRLPLQRRVQRPVLVRPGVVRRQGGVPVQSVPLIAERLMCTECPFHSGQINEVALICGFLVPLIANRLMR